MQHRCKLKVVIALLRVGQHVYNLLLIFLLAMEGMSAGHHDHLKTKSWNAAEDAHVWARTILRAVLEVILIMSWRRTGGAMYLLTWHPGVSAIAAGTSKSPPSNPGHGALSRHLPAAD